MMTAERVGLSAAVLIGVALMVSTAAQQEPAVETLPAPRYPVCVHAPTCGETASARMI